MASDTRIGILEALYSGSKTLKGLCDELGLAKATVSEHLSKLIDAGLIEQVNKGSKWVYYQLTEVGGGYFLGDEIFLLFSANGWTKVKLLYKALLSFGFHRTKK